MESTRHIETRLPQVGSRLERIARTFSDNFGVTVVFQGEQCSTDQKGVIVLPVACDRLSTEDMDLVWAKVNHEAEHVKVQREGEAATAAKLLTNCNAGILGLLSFRRLEAVPHGVTVTEALQPVSLTGKASKISKMAHMWLNVVEDIRIERRASERYEGVAIHLAKGRAYAAKKWEDKLTGHPHAVDIATQAGVAVIFQAWGHPTPWLAEGAKEAVAALAPILAHLGAVVTFWDSYNLALAILEAVETAGLSLPEPEPKPEAGKPSKPEPGEGEPGEGEPGEGEPSPGGEDGAEGEEGAGGDSESAPAPASGKEGTEGSGSGTPEPGEHDKPDTEVDAREALRRLRTAVPTCVNPLEQPIEDGIKAAGSAIRLKYPAGRAPEYRVHPAAAAGDSVIVLAPTAKTNEMVAAERQAISRQAATLAAQLRSLLQSQALARQVLDRDTGTLDRRSLHRINRPGQLPDTNVFKQVIPGKAQDIAIQLVMDCSGSMMSGCGDKYKLARAGMLLLGDTFTLLQPLGIQWAGFGFTANGAGSSSGVVESGVDWGRTESVQHYMFKGWSEDWRRVAGRLYHGYATMNNADADAVKWACASISQVRAKRRIILVLSDGAPMVGGNMASQARELAATVKGAWLAGIEVYGLGIIDASVKHYYPIHEVVKTTEQLNVAMVKMARRWLLNEKPNNLAA
jgi:cobalamin biosynthesis protein CobT